MNKQEHRSDGKFIVGAALGAVVGAVAGILFAPRSGKETRKIISERAKKYKDEGREYIAKETETAKESIKNTIEKIKK